MQRTRHLPITLAGGLMAAVLANPLGAQTTHVVTQPGFSFAPANIVIDVGDTVEWQWSFETHTVTEGPGPTPTGGEAFDEPFDATNPTVRVTFDRTFLKAFPRTDNVYDYYCIPHFIIGMTGSITVRETLGIFADQSQVIPPTGSSATGSGSVTLNLATNTLDWNLSYSGLSGLATAAHFHAAPAGSNGPVALGIGTANPNVGSAVLSVADEATVLAGGWYLNVHTAADPSGELRGQIHSGDWTDLGGGTSGVNGVPKLIGIGPLTGLSTLTLGLSDGPPNELVLLWLSVASTPINVLGGTMHAVPFLDQVLLVTNADGAFVAGTVFPPFVPSGSNIWFQYILQDLSVIFNLTLSNAVRSTMP